MFYRALLVLVLLVCIKGEEFEEDINIQAAACDSQDNQGVDSRLQGGAKLAQQGAKLALQGTKSAEEGATSAQQGARQAQDEVTGRQVPEGLGEVKAKVRKVLAQTAARLSQLIVRVERLMGQASDNNNVADDMEIVGNVNSKIGDNPDFVVGLEEVMIPNQNEIGKEDMIDNGVDIDKDLGDTEDMGEYTGVGANDNIINNMEVLSGIREELSHLQALCRWVKERVDGRVSLESRPTKGADRQTVGSDRQAVDWDWHRAWKLMMAVIALFFAGRNLLYKILDLWQ